MLLTDCLQKVHCSVLAEEAIAAALQDYKIKTVLLKTTDMKDVRDAVEAVAPRIYAVSTFILMKNKVV